MSYVFFSSLLNNPKHSRHDFHKIVGTRIHSVATVEIFSKYSVSSYYETGIHDILKQNANTRIIEKN